MALRSDLARWTPEQDEAILSGIEEAMASGWDEDDRDEAARIRRLLGAGWVRMWLHTLSYSSDGQVMFSLLPAGYRAVNARRRRMGLEELERGE